MQQKSFLKKAFNYVCISLVQLIYFCYYILVQGLKFWSNSILFMHAIIVDDHDDSEMSLDQVKEVNYKSKF